jgi:hypothetical protein
MPNTSCVFSISASSITMMALASLRVSSSHIVLPLLIVTILFIQYPIAIVHTPPLFILLGYKLEDVMQVTL